MHLGGSKNKYINRHNPAQIYLIDRVRLGCLKNWFLDEMLCRMTRTHEMVPIFSLSL